MPEINQTPYTDIHAEYIGTAEAILFGAKDQGIDYQTASMEPEQKELYLTVRNQDGSAWIQHLTAAGFSFSNPTTTYRTPRGTVAEAVGNDGRVILHMLDELPQ